MDVTPALASLLFAVDLDGRSIGTHNFQIERGPEGGETVRSTAAFTARVLGVPLYRYRHEAVEQWSQGCLRSLSASTDDDGHRTRVEATTQGDSLSVTAPDGRREVAGCVRSFAYWAPDRLAAPSLLNPQTGQLEPARIETLGQEPLVRLDGHRVDARHLRLQAAKLVIDLWYDAAGEWLQLVSTTAEGRHLRYRRQ